MPLPTPANQLTLLRIVLIPFFAMSVAYGYPGAALLVFAVAGLTDLLDGLIARLTQQRTDLGAWLDPMADKLLLVTVLVVLTVPSTTLVNHVPLWLTILIISRDVVIVSVVAIVNLAVGPRTFRPSLWGKIATATYLVMSIVFLYYNYRQTTALLVQVSVWAALVVTLVSSGDYILRIRRVLSETH